MCVWKASQHTLVCEPDSCHSLEVQKRTLGAFPCDQCANSSILMTVGLMLHHNWLTYMFVFFLMKASPTLVLATIITVYGFVQPYKSRTANLLEMGVQVNFLLLLLIEATSNIRDLYFTFPPLLQSNVTSEPECVDSPTGIAPITWILMPFYYLPLLVFTLVACVTFALYIRYIYTLQWSQQYMQARCRLA